MKSKISFDPALCQDLLDRDLSEYFRMEGPSSRSDTRFAADALSRSFLKKFAPPSASVELAATAVENFKKANTLCSKKHTLSDQRLKLLKFWSTNDFGGTEIPDSWEEIFSVNPLRSGPGASTFSEGKNSCYEKIFENRLVYTNVKLAHAFLRAHAADPTLRRALNWRNQNGNGALAYVPESKLTTVPKNRTTDRTIVVESSIHMCGQLLVGDIINGVLKRYGYDAAVQQIRNRTMAQWGSLSGHWATIDLKWASDLIATLTCRDILDPRLFAALMDCRSEAVNYNGEVIPLFMMSSMGNGFTFPLETYIFTLALRLALYELGYLELLELPDFRNMKYGVFGDDIICPAAVFDHLSDILRCFGFIVNTDKSFNDGHFRESCGGDYYHGIDVRGVYCQQLNTIGDYYSVINRLIRWSTRTGIPLPLTVNYLLPKRWKLDCVPPDEADTSGLKTYSVGPREYFAWKPRIRSVTLDPETINPAGVLVCNSAGLMGGLNVTRRDDKPIYTRERCFTPEWLHSYSADLQTLIGHDRLNHRFASQFTTGYLAIERTEGVLPGLTVSEWSEMLSRHIDVSLIKRVKPLKKV